MAKRIQDFTVHDNTRLTPDFFVLDLVADAKLPEILPGQFVEARVPGSAAAFLRRPLSVHDVDYRRNAIRLLVQIAGAGTQRLSELKKGDVLNLVYPLGNSFSLPSPAEKRVLLIGGGCGVAPLLFLGRYLKEKGFTPVFLQGYRTESQILEPEAYAALGPIYTTTEDGSMGHKGFVIRHPVLFGEEKPFDKIYACGPEAMMKVVARYARQRDIVCEVSLEHTMACGIGACLCCVVETRRGNVCTCTEGPVFNIQELTWQS